MADLISVEARLRGILEPYRETLAVKEDDRGVVLEVPGQEGTPWGYVAGTRLGKRYVSYYLMGVYGLPELLDGISPELRGRMQGKSCFNFRTIDEPLVAELAALTARTIPRHGELVEAAQAARRRR